MVKGVKKRPQKKNEKRNERRSKRVGEIKDFLFDVKYGMKCVECGTIDYKVLVFYGRHRDYSFRKLMEGKKTLKTVKKIMHGHTILCLNHAATRRFNSEDTYSRDSRY